MRFGVTSKLFLVFLATNVAIALAVAIAAQIAVNTGFRDYVNEREERRLSNLSDALTDAYREHGNWEFLRGNDALWRAFNRPVRRDRSDSARTRIRCGLPLHVARTVRRRRRMTTADRRRAIGRRTRNAERRRGLERRLLSFR